MTFVPHRRHFSSGDSPQVGDTGSPSNLRTGKTSHLSALELARTHSQQRGAFFTGEYKSKFDNFHDGACPACSAPDSISKPSLPSSRRNPSTTSCCCCSMGSCSSMSPGTATCTLQPTCCRSTRVSPPALLPAPAVQLGPGHAPLHGRLLCHTKKNPSTALSSWAVVSATHGQVLAQGLPPGIRQGSTRAELYAILQGIKWLLAGHHRGHIWSDSNPEVPRPRGHVP